ncbi:MAG: MFS transporter, partial [Methanobacteriota archaeon]
MTHGDGPRASTVDSARSHARIILAIILAVGLLDVIDFSIVFVALPSIQRDLRIPLAESQWIVGAYGLTLAGFLMLSGRAGDVYGQKRLFLAGISLFTVASFVAGLSPSFLPLVIARGFQGIGAAITAATALAILAATFPEGRARNRALGVFVAALSAGFAAGSLLGGVLTAAFGWRSVLFVNVPVGITGAVLAQRFLTRDAGRAEDRQLDLPGALTVTSGLLLLVYAMTNAAELGFAAPLTVIPLAVAGVVLALFVVIEHRSAAPLMPLGFLRRGTILRANVLGLILAASPPGILFILTIFLQEILGYSALFTALAFLPATLVFFVVGGFGASRLVNRFGVRRVLVLSSGLMT